MGIRIVESWLLLLYFDYVMHWQGFPHVHDVVHRQAAIQTSGTTAAIAADVCRAIDIASVLYFKRVLCLQRSAATTVLLRRHGIKAEMVIGAQMIPFRSHAWVEVDGAVVNDKPYMPELFQELSRC